MVCRSAARSGRTWCPRSGSDAAATEGSIIVVLATDAPLLPIQCQRLARRATTGLAWVGGIGANGSGDIFIAFSTGNHIGQNDRITTVRMLAPDAMTSLFQAAAEATEEAILNALCMAETMPGGMDAPSTRCRSTACRMSCGGTGPRSARERQGVYSWVGAPSTLNYEPLTPPIVRPALMQWRNA